MPGYSVYDLRPLMIPKRLTVYHSSIRAHLKIRGHVDSQISSNTDRRCLPDGYDLTKPKIFSTTEANFTATQKNRFGIFLAPGAVINNDTLIYGKLSYNSMKGELSANDGSLSETFRGIGYGFGVKTMISPTVFMKVEVNRISYGGEIIDGVTYKPSGTTGVLGIGTSF